MANEMTPIQAAYWLDTMARINLNPHEEKSLDMASSILRRVASGEYALVVHAHCIDRGNDCFCSNCNSPNVAHGQKYCEDCGARLDGKDDSNA